LIATEPLGEIEGLVLRGMLFASVSIRMSSCASTMRGDSVLERAAIEAKINKLVGRSIASRNGAKGI
jgi:hypothetical protein